MSEYTMTCTCDDFEPQMEFVNGPLMLQVARTGKGHFEGKVFMYCPWCGEKLETKLLTE